MLLLLLKPSHLKLRLYFQRCSNSWKAVNFLFFTLCRSTVKENLSKSLIQLCERSELHFHFEWTKVNQKWQISPIWRSFRSNSVNRQVNFNWTKIVRKCRKWKILMGHLGWFSNTVGESIFCYVDYHWIETRQTDRQDLCEPILEGCNKKLKSSHWKLQLFITAQFCIRVSKMSGGGNALL